MITDVEMEAMQLMLNHFVESEEYSREYRAMEAMQDMLADLDSEWFYSASDKEKNEFVKNYIDSIERNRDELQSNSRWICVYKRSLGYPAPADELAAFEVPSEWLENTLSSRGITDIEDWLENYSYDVLDDLVSKALEDKVIIRCDDEDVMSLVTLRWENPDLFELSKTVREWVDAFGEDGPNEVGFEYNGTRIKNPFYDETLRFEVEPFTYYGKDNMVAYLEQANRLITENSYKKSIDEAVRDLFFVNKDNVIELYADYRDTGEFLYKDLYENRDSAELDNIIHDQIWEAYADEISNREDEVLERAGVLGEEYEQEALEYLRDKYSFEPPYGHFLSHEMKVNIMLATPEEQNGDCVSIREQYIAMEDPDRLVDPSEVLSETSGLSWLLEQQGYSMDDLQATLKDYDGFFYTEDGSVRQHFDKSGRELRYTDNIKVFNQNHNAFLSSVCSELEKDLVFSADMIRDVQIEGVKPQFEYTVDDTYGLIGSCWKEPVSIRDVRKPELDEVIKGATEIHNNISGPNTRDSRDLTK